jgi:hypothetical protein
MQNSKHEEPQRGHPNRLTINQHVFPAASIARFADNSGRVCVTDKRRPLIRRAKPKDAIFCAKRAWDQRAEAGYMRTIEDEFQKLASEIIGGTVTEIGPREKGIIDRFWALWFVRARNQGLGVGEVQLRGVTGPGRRLSRDQEEKLEANGCLCLREGGKLPARQLNGLRTQSTIDPRWLTERGPVGDHSCAGGRIRRA